MAPTGFLLCGFSYPQVFFTVAFSGYVLAMEFPSPPPSPERYHRHFKNISFVFCTQKNDTSTREFGPATLVSLSQCDQNIHLHLARVTTRDLDNIFALNKTANAILGVRQRHNKDKPCLL